MKQNKIIKESIKWRKVAQLEELFFYTLYRFNAYWVIGVISAYTAKRIKQDTGVDVHNYQIRLQSNYLIHFLNEHFNEKRKGQRNIHFDDMRKLAEVVHNYTTVRYEYGDDILLFETRFPNNNRFQFAVEIDYENKLLLGKSFRIKT